jgi:flagellar basal body rod protein FlgF
MSQGALQKTGNPLDVAIQGTGFFAVQTANGVDVHAQWQLSGLEHRAVDYFSPEIR